MQGSQRGVSNSKEQKNEVLKAVQVLAEQGKDRETVKAGIDASWKLLWTTEKVATMLFHLRDCPDIADSILVNWHRLALHEQAHELVHCLAAQAPPPNDQTDMDSDATSSSGRLPGILFSRSQNASRSK